MAEKRIRIDMRVPESIMNKVDEYKEKNGVLTRTAAILELIRKGLDKK